MPRLYQQKFPVIDIHTHFFSKEWLQRIFESRGESLETMRARSEKRGIPPFEPIARNDLLEVWKQEIEKYQLERVAIFIPQFEANDVFPRIGKYNEYLLPFFHVDKIDETLLPHLKQIAETYSISGIKMVPNIFLKHVYDPELIPIWEFAAEKKLPVTIHFGIEIAPQADSRYMNPFDLQPVARDFPDVNFIIPHFGAGFLRETLLLQYQVDNVYVDTSGSNSWMRYLPYKITLKDVYDRFLDVAGSEKILFGTDSSSFPRGFRNQLLEEHLLLTQEMGLNDSDRENIFYRNAANLLKISH